MPPSRKHTLTPPPPATMRLVLDVHRTNGERIAALIEEVRRAAGDEVAITSLSFEPVALELTGPAPLLEALRSRSLPEGLRRALGSWRPSFTVVSAATRPAPGRGHRVLVVDGDATRARADADALARARIEACTVSSLEVAQALLQRSSFGFDAIVLRHVLADGEGVDLFARVGPEERRCSVLVIDDRVRPELARAYRRLGAFRYIGPPASPLQLVSRVNATMLDTQAWRQVESPHAEVPGEPPRQLLDPEQAAARLEHVLRLSTTERDVALMVLLGLRDLEIADKLGQSERTAKRYVGKVLEKAGIDNRASLWGVLHKDGLGLGAMAEPVAERVAAVPVVRTPSPVSPSPAWTPAQQVA